MIDGFNIGMLQNIPEASKVLILQVFVKEFGPIDTRQIKIG